MRPSSSKDAGGGSGPLWRMQSAPRIAEDAEAAAFAEAYERVQDPRHRACIRWFVFELADNA